MDNIILRFENLLERNHLKAIHIMKKAIENEPNNTEYLSAYGVYLCRNEHLAEGIKLLVRAQNIKELDPGTTFVLAIAYMKQDKYLPAANNFKKVASLYPEAYYNSAICYLRLRNYKKAIAQARELTTSDILGKEAYNFIVDVLLIDFKSEEAEQELLKYEKKFGKDDTYHFMAGNIKFNNMDFLYSSFHYSKIVTSGIDKESYFSKYAMSLFQNKQYAKAAEIYKEVLKTDDYDQSSVIDYAYSLYEIGKYQEVLDVLERYKGYISDLSAFRDLRAKAYYKLNLK